MNYWSVCSPCTPRCVISARSPATTMTALRRWRGAAAVLACAPAAARGDGLGSPARRLLEELGVEVVADSERLSVPATRGTLVVANHLSWLDIVASLAVEPTGFLAKREVRDWPVLGRLAERRGTLFLGRAELRQLPRVVRELADTLRSGRSVLVFPEGTTWCGGAHDSAHDSAHNTAHRGGKFRRAVFQAAIDAGAPIRPVTFEYRQGGERSTVASFVGDDTLAASLRRVVRARDLSVHVCAHEPFSPVGDRRDLAARAEAVVHGWDRGRSLRVVHA